MLFVTLAIRMVTDVSGPTAVPVLSLVIVAVVPDPVAVKPPSTPALGVANETVLASKPDENATVNFPLAGQTAPVVKETIYMDCSPTIGLFGVTETLVSCAKAGVSESTIARKRIPKI